MTGVCSLIHQPRAHLSIEVGGKGARALHDSEHVRTLALVGRDDANLLRLDTCAHEVRHYLLHRRRLCTAHTHFHTVLVA